MNNLVKLSIALCCVFCSNSVLALSVTSYVEKVRVVLAATDELTPAQERKLRKRLDNLDVDGWPTAERQIYCNLNILAHLRPLLPEGAHLQEVGVRLGDPICVTWRQDADHEVFVCWALFGTGEEAQEHLLDVILAGGSPSTLDTESSQFPGGIIAKWHNKRAIVLRNLFLQVTMRMKSRKPLPLVTSDIHTEESLSQIMGAIHAAVSGADLGEVRYVNLSLSDDAKTIDAGSEHMFQLRLPPVLQDYEVVVLPVQQDVAIKRLERVRRDQIDLIVEAHSGGEKWLEVVGAGSHGRISRSLVKFRVTEQP